MHYSSECSTYQDLFIINFESTLTNYKHVKDLNNKIDFIKFKFYLFEVFKSLKNKVLYLITKEISNLNIYTIIDNKIYTILKHPKELVLFKYFTNNIDKEILISSTENNIFIYDPSKQFNLILLINSKLVINNILLIFNNKKEDYIIYSHNNWLASLSLLKTGKAIKFIDNTKKCNDKCLIYWYNKKNEKCYLILLCFQKILIVNILEDEIYAETIFEYGSINFHGLTYSKDNTDYLCFSSFNGYITIFDLDNKNIYKKIYCPKCRLIEIFSLSERYLVSSNYNLSEFIIIDLEEGKIVSSYRSVYEDCIYNAKTINIEKYGKCILTCGSNKKIHLWKIFN